MPRLESLRAKVGATILDVFRPGWAKEINLRALKLSSCDSCVLGQLFGDYNTGAEELFAMRGEDYEQAAYKAGFVALPPDVYEGTRETPRMNYDNLTAAWKREIEKRKGR